jgi:DNA-binding CsgD family transcriptional regulator
MLFYYENNFQRAGGMGDQWYVADVLGIHTGVNTSGGASYAIRLALRTAENSTHSPFCTCPCWPHPLLLPERSVPRQGLESLTMHPSGSLPPDLQFRYKWGRLTVEEPAFARPAVARQMPALSQRQMHILRLMSRGMQNKAIAHEIHLSEGTVKNHVRLLMKKFGAHNRTQAVRKATELGMVSMDGSKD